MKLRRNIKFSIENFSDGEVMLYDNNGEIYHILNNTAAYVLSIIERDSYEEARSEYVSWVARTFGETDTAVLEKDYDNLIKDLLQKDILIIGNTTV